MSMLACKLKCAKQWVLLWHGCTSYALARNARHNLYNKL